MSTTIPVEPALRNDAAPPEVPHSYHQRRRPLDAGLYFLMVELGPLGEDDPLFLWKRELVEKMTKGNAHNFALGELHSLAQTIVPPGFHIRQEQPVQLGDYGVPEPDLAVVRGPRRTFAHRCPAASDVALLIKVADSSLPLDRGEVLQEYARWRIPKYWIVNLVDRRVEVHNEPTGPDDPQPSYRSVRHFGEAEEVPVVLDGREAGRSAVKDILP